MKSVDSSQEIPWKVISEKKVTPFLELKLSTQFSKSHWGAMTCIGEANDWHTVVLMSELEISCVQEAENPTFWFEP